jgi:hypothetical protein
MAHIDHFSGRQPTKGSLGDLFRWAFQAKATDKRLARSGMLILSLISFGTALILIGVSLFT